MHGRWPWAEPEVSKMFLQDLIKSCVLPRYSFVHEKHGLRKLDVLVVTDLFARWWPQQLAAIADLGVLRDGLAANELSTGHGTELGKLPHVGK